MTWSPTEIYLKVILNLNFRKSKNTFSANKFRFVVNCRVSSSIYSKGDLPAGESYSLNREFIGSCIKLPRVGFPWPEALIPCHRSNPSSPASFPKLQLQRFLWHKHWMSLFITAGSSTILKKARETDCFSSQRGGIVLLFPETRKAALPHFPSSKFSMSLKRHCTISDWIWCCTFLMLTLSLMLIRRNVAEL